VTVNIGISDLRGVEGAFNFNWNEEPLAMSSGLVTNDIYSSGIHTSVDLKAATEYNFSFSTGLRGSRRLSVVPLGKQSAFSMESPWTEPNFEGSFATQKYESDEEGFTAHWEVSHLNRNYPQSWIGRQYAPTSDYFGTEFVRTVDSYSKTNRVAKYAILIIALTFMVFYFSELIKGSKVNALQYVLVGLALVLFYTLLLSFSEHIGFNAAYAVAALMTIAMEFLYSKSVLGSAKLAAYVAGVLALLYSFIFVLIQLKDFALLAGSLGLFVILGVIMYISRQIRWEE
jgi:inner membrane protein